MSKWRWNAVLFDPDGFGRCGASCVAPSGRQFLPPFPRIKCGATAQPASRAGLPPKGALPGSRPGQAYQATVPPRTGPHTCPRRAVAARIVDTYRTHPADTSRRVCSVVRIERLGPVLGRDPWSCRKAGAAVVRSTTRPPGSRLTIRGALRDVPRTTLPACAGACGIEADARTALRYVHQTT